MLRARWYKVINDLLVNKTRTLLVILSLAVGLFAVGMIFSAQSILSEGMARSFIEINPSSGTVHTVEPFDEDFLQSVRSMKEVQEADARHSVQARIKTSAGNWMNITIFAIADYNDIRVNKVTPQSGAWPPPKHEILFERAGLPLLNAQIGNTVLIELPNGTQRVMRIAGTAHDPAQLPAPMNSTPYGYISMDTLEWLGEPYGFNELYVITTNPEDKVWAQQVINLIKNKVEKSGYTIPGNFLTVDPGQIPMNEILQGLLLLMGALGVLSLFLSVFLIVNTISALLAQQKRQIGIMKAIGGTSLQIFGMYLVMVISYGILALLIAIPPAIAGARALSQSLASFFNFDLTAMQIPPQAILLQVGIGLILPVLASTFPFLLSLRVSAAEAMGTYTIGKGRFSKNPIDRLLSGANLWFIRKISIRPILLSIRNTFRNKGRLVLTLITLTLSSATFISVLTVRASLFSTVNDLLQWMNFDMMVSFDRLQRTAEVRQEALEVSGITKTDTLLQLPVRRVRPDGSESDTMSLFALPVDSRLIRSAEIFEGRWLIPEDENALVVGSGFLQKEPDVGVGKTIVLKIDGQEHPFTIIGVSVGTPFSVSIYANYPYIAKISDSVGRANVLMVTTQAHESDSIRTENIALVDYLKRAGVEVNSVSTIASMQADAATAFNAIVALLFVMAIMLALVGGLGLMGTMSINVLERTREIGVLRTIGAPNRGVAQVFILEGIGIGLMSWFLGSLLAIPMSQMLSEAVGKAVLGVPLTYSYSMFGLWLWLIIVILLSALASFMPARNASRLTVREVLAYE